jgi:hypothetical protein
LCRAADLAVLHARADETIETVVLFAAVHMSLPGTNLPIPNVALRDRFRG